MHWKRKPLTLPTKFAPIRCVSWITTTRSPQGQQAAPSRATVSFALALEAEWHDRARLGIASCIDIGGRNKVQKLLKGCDG